MTFQTFSPSFMHNFSISMNLLSLTPLSITLASSIALNEGGPDSNLGELNGSNSAVTIKFPLSCESGYGAATSIFIPTKTSVFPIFTLALPSAFFEIPVSIVISLNSSSFLSSNLFLLQHKFLFLPLLQVQLPQLIAFLLSFRQAEYDLFSRRRLMLLEYLLPLLLLPSPLLPLSNQLQGFCRVFRLKRLSQDFSLVFLHEPKPLQQHLFLRILLKHLPAVCLCEHLLHF